MPEYRACNLIDLFVVTVLTLKRILLLSLCCVVTASAFGQARDFGGIAQKEALKKLSFMVGTWDGDGWVEMAGHKSTFQGTETILEKCEGALLSLEGNHYVMAGDRKIPIHNAFGFIRFDDKTGKYYMRSHLANGLEMEYEFTPKADGYVWSQTSPSWGDVTYTAVFKDGDWLEYGETSKDGKVSRVYEMHMKRRSS